jgi:hypothetical protein
MSGKDTIYSTEAVDASKQPSAAAVAVKLSPKPNLISQLLFLFVSPIVR